MRRRGTLAEGVCRDWRGRGVEEEWVVCPHICSLVLVIVVVERG